MADLSAAGYCMEDAYALFKITDFRDIFFTPNGAAKSSKEVSVIVNGSFNHLFCRDIYEFTSQKDARCLLGYTRPFDVIKH